MAPATSDAKRRLSKLLRAPDPGTPKGRERQLGEIRQLSASIKEAELVEVSRNMDARRREAMDSWARAPGVGNTRRRSRGGSDEPPEREALRMVAYLYRSGLPKRLRMEDFSHGRLSAKEALELLDLCQRAMRGGSGFNAEDIPRRDMLLEKACGATPGVVARWYEEMINVNDHWVRKADVDAYEQARAEFKDAEAKFYAVRSKLPPALWGPQF